MQPTCILEKVLMIRRIVRIDEEKCDGCGLCVPACAEGAIQLIDGKARLVSDVYCDGLGACLGECPQGAITIEERDANPFDEAAAREHVAALEDSTPEVPCGCPGSMVMELEGEPAFGDADAGAEPSALRNWPVQLKLVPPNAPYFQGADLLLVADCVPFAVAGFHARFLRGRPVVVGCPKLDDAAFYSEKLAELLRQSEVNSITVVHMEVPCCSGLTRIAEGALAASGKSVEARDVTISIQGEILRERDLTNEQIEMAHSRGGT